jgi:hypothetical protein
LPNAGNPEKQVICDLLRPSLRPLIWSESAVCVTFASPLPQRRVKVLACRSQRRPQIILGLLQVVLPRRRDR